MAGIYFHIPFCKQACHYCDFHFSTSLKYKDEMLDALKKELNQRKNYIKASKIDSIYFGGGTPSILNASEIQSLIDLVSQNFELNNDAEITLEANPDDLSAKKVNELRNSDVNRFSIGIQSFYEEDLLWMNRAHNAQEADSSIKRIQDAGFENISCDLIYGFPLLTEDKWKNNIQTLIDLEITHISCYSMTVEPRTALAKFIEKGKTAPMSDGQSAQQFETLVNKLNKNSYEQYEISNFAKDKNYAKHNTSYWQGKEYLGIGPSAHSFDGHSRSWNVANNALYIQAVSSKEKYSETEILSINDRINEYIMTSLRTMWGINLENVSREYGVDIQKQLLLDAEGFIQEGKLILDNNMLKLSFEGKLIADHIASELFIIE